MSNGEDKVIKVSHLVALLKRLEWEVKLARLALLQLDQGTTVKPTPELEEHLKASVPVADYTVPPC